MSIEETRKQYPPGTRIELISMDDPQAPPAGTQGAVQCVDDMGDLIVQWENGCALNVCPDVDKVHIISRERTC